MGVHGLWEILHPVARPIALETLGNKKLAIDSSIWLYQFQLAIRDKEGRALDNAHILGFLRRITKLLFYGIKPVFVFDGGAPLVKKLAISERKKRKRGGAENLAKTAEKLLAAQLRQQAVAEAQRRQLMEETGDLVNADTVYLEDLPAGIAARGAPEGSAQFHGDAEPPLKKKKYVHRDAYALPAMDASIQAKATLQDPRLATEDELREFIEDMRPEDFDIDSEWFNGLSTEIKYEIIGDLRIKSRQANHRRVDAMKKSATALDFSKAQIKHLMERNDLTQKLLTVTDDISKSHLQIPIRIASERSKHYVLIKNDASQGGGWALGIQDPKQTGTKDAPLKVDTTTTESDTERSRTSEGEFEEVKIPALPRKSPSPESSPRNKKQNQARRDKAISAIKQRYSPTKTLEDDDFVPVPLPSRKRLFADEDLDAVMLAAGDDLELTQDAAFSVSNPSTKKIIPQRTREPSTSEDDSMFEVVDVEKGSEQPDSMGTSAAAVIPDSRSADLINPIAQGTLHPATEIENAVVSRDYAVAESDRPRHGADDDAQDPLDQEPLDDGPSIVAAALAGNSSDSDSNSDADARVLPPLLRANKVIQKAASALPLPQTAIPQQEQKAPTPPSQIKRSQKPLPSTSSRAPSPRSLKPLSPRQMGKLPERASPDLSPKPLPAPESFKATSIENAILESVMQEKQAQRVIRSASPEWDESARRQSASDWSASSSPSPAASTSKQREYGPNDVPEDFPLLTAGHELSEEEMDAGDKDELEIAVNIQSETARFSSFLKDLQNRNLDQVRGEVEAEIAQLKGQRKKDRRDAEDITQQMSKDIQGMLRLFGLPYVVAPMEAEAQCAELYRLHLVDGIITDDSDVFLFDGGGKVYKNLFNQAKYVELYLASDIDRELGLKREDLIKLGYLLGSDYCHGIKGVGPVSALEIMKEFVTLEKFKDWWRRVQNGRDTADDTDTAFKRRFKKAQLKKELYLDESWPDPEVRQAYTSPSVDSSKETFRWGIPDLDGLRSYLSEHLGWSSMKVDDLLTPLIKRMHQRSQGIANMQGSLDAFFDISGGSSRFQKSKHTGSSARMQNVIRSWKASQKLLDSNDATVDDLLQPASSEDDRPRSKPTKRRRPKKRASLDDKIPRTSKPRKAPRGKKAPIEETDESEIETREAVVNLPRGISRRKAAGMTNYQEQRLSGESSESSP